MQNDRDARRRSAGPTPSTGKALVWLHGEVRTPPFSREARIEAGHLLRLIQQGELLSLPHSRPMPSIGAGCHELRINDRDKTWRLVYWLDADAVYVLDVFAKKTAATPNDAIRRCRQRLKVLQQTLEG